MRVVTIVQARMGSTRLPGKVLKDLGGKSVLTQVIERVRQCSSVDEVSVATTLEPADNVIVEECRKTDTQVFRGSVHDVLERYYLAAQTAKADVVVRITSDCPLIDPDVSDRTIGRFLEDQPDYASNTLVRTYPRGLDTEVMTFTALECAWKNAQLPYERVHVTPYIYGHAKKFRLLSVVGDKDYSKYRWTLDTPEDLKFLRAVYERLGSSQQFSWCDVLRLIEQEPTLVQINSHVAQKALHEG